MADKLQKLRLGLVNGSSQALVKDLLDDLQDARILSDAEVEYINEGFSQSRDKIRALIDMVKKKGDRSSEFLIKKVSERDRMLSDKLGIPVVHPLPTQEQSGSSSSQSVVHPLPSQVQNGSLPRQPASSDFQVPFQEKNQDIKPETTGIKKCSVEDFCRITSQVEPHQIYHIERKNERTRLALIICNKTFDSLPERNGAEFDVAGMENLLTELGYKVQVENNLSVEVMKHTMKTFSQKMDHNTSDSTFIVIMSHGVRDRICGTDTCQLTNGEPDKVLHVDEIFDTFNNVNCRALQNKPKIIIIQACRGHGESRVYLSDGACAISGDENKHLEDDAIQRIQRERDFACFCSTTPDTKSWRDPEKGSLFIQELIKHMKEDAYRYSILDIFRDVQQSFKDNVQMPTLERTTLLKKFYLFPGH